MIEFGCKNCGRFFRVADSNAGKKGTCPDCKGDVVVPSLDVDISFEENEIEFSNTLSFEISKFYEILVQLRDSIGLVGTKTYPERNIFFATFQTAPGRQHTASIIQQEPGGIINCITTIGNANQLSKTQLIEILKKFNSEDGMLFNAGVDEDNNLIAQKLFQTPPEDPAEFCILLQFLAKLGDDIESAFFGVDEN